MSVTVLGIRHHGPGSARAVAAALAEINPDLILVEGPAEGDGALAYTGSLTPPVALTVYAIDEPRDAAFWPLAEFSPEWQALRHGAAAGIPVRFIDLPFGNTLTLLRQQRAATLTEPRQADNPAEIHSERPAEGANPDTVGSHPVDPDPSTAGGDAEPVPAAPLIDDPLGWLALAAGHDDPERFWEDLVEHRRVDPDRPGGPGGRSEALALFAAVAEAMTQLRADHGDPAAAAGGSIVGAGPVAQPSAEIARQRREQMREAHMRLEIRKAGNGADAAARIAVICGAWHVPALTGTAGATSATADRELLRGPRPVRTATTWVPWTHALLATASGYGAGITSPGWYQHLWSAPDQVTARWVARVASLLRAADLPASPASVVETVRLAETLAAVRDRSLPGLTELTDAVLAGLCAGDPVPLEVVREQLVVGDVLGAVGADAPAVPLAADLARTQRRLRLQPTAADRAIRLDLRKDTDRERSRLLHRLRLLDVPWGTPVVTASTGTFTEAWTLRWDPAYAVAVIAAARHGATVADAAASVVTEQARSAADLPTITGMLEQVVLAGLPDALAAVTAGLERRAAGTGDIAHLMAALAPLARVHRYGDVRATDTTLVTTLAESLMVRICAGLPPACQSLDDDAARTVAAAVDTADTAFRLIADPEHVGHWHTAVRAVADAYGGNSLVTGRCAGILSDAGEIDPADVAVRLARALSAAGGAPADAAQWLAGFLGVSGSVLARNPGLLGLIDAWLSSLDGAAFTVVLAPLRRVFAAFSIPERRMIAERVRAVSPRPGAGGTGLVGPGMVPAQNAAGITGPAGDPAAWDFDRVTRVLPTITALLGIPGVGGSPEHG